MNKITPPYPTLPEWVEANKPKDEMLWKGAFEQSVLRMIALTSWCEAVKAPALVVSTHTSKSITLPVIRFQTDHAAWWMRDNLHDVELAFMADRPINVDLSGIFHYMSAVDYTAALKRARGWHERHAKDSESLRDVKQGWLLKYPDNLGWYEQYGGGKLVRVGEAGSPEAVYYILSRCYRQGMEYLGLRDWCPGMAGGTISVDADRAMKFVAAFESTC
jgi:hypothetical protein